MKLKKTHTRILFCVFVALFVCFVSTKANGQANNVITGFIFGAERRPISDVSVELSDENYSLLSRTKTDGSGRYIFTRLRRARYNLRVSPIATDYEGQTKDVEISGISRGGAADAGSDTIQQNFYLRLKSQESNTNLAIKGVVFAQDVPKEAQKLYETALSELKDKKVEIGLANLKSALQILPTYYLALDRLGQEYIGQQKYQEATEVLTNAVFVNPKSFSSHYSLGYSLHQLQKYPEAVDALKKSVELAPTSVNGFYILGLTLKKLGQFGSAVENLKKADKLANSQQADIHWQLSLIYTNNLKRYADAANELELFLKVKPDYEEADKVRDLIKKLRAK